MPKTYHECDSFISDTARKIIQKYHPDLIEADVTIMYMFARNDKGDALTHGGYPATALAKINNLRDRVAGLTDATILIDEERWEELSDESKDALLDHELHHFVVRRNKIGAFEYDDQNRPLLRMRKHDWQMGGFNEIVKRHREAALEYQAVEHVNSTWVQMELFVPSAA